EVRELLRQGQKERALRLWYSIGYPEPGTSHLVEQAVQAAQSTSTDFFLHHITPDPEDDIVSLCPQVSVPTLFMNCTAVCGAPVEAGRYLAEHIPGAQFSPFNGRGHLLIYTSTSEFCEVLRCFVRTGAVPAR